MEIYPKLDKDGTTPTTPRFARSQHGFDRERTLMPTTELPRIYRAGVRGSEGYCFGTVGSKADLDFLASGSW